MTDDELTIKAVMSLKNLYLPDRPAYNDKKIIGTMMVSNYRFFCGDDKKSLDTTCDKRQDK